MTTITKKQILLSLELADKADKKNSSGCDQCWIHYLVRMAGFETISHPCSNVKKVLNEQYHTKFGFEAGFGSCDDYVCPRDQVLAIFKRTVKI